MLRVVDFASQRQQQYRTVVAGAAGTTDRRRANWELKDVKLQQIPLSLIASLHARCVTLSNSCCLDPRFS